MHLINRRWFAIIVPALVGFGLAALCVRAFESYGWSLFLGLPILVCFLSGFCYSFGRKVRFSVAYGVSLASLLCLGGCILVLALDGIICLVMAFPLAAGLGVLGTLYGVWAGGACRRGVSSSLSILLVGLFPVLMALDRNTAPTESIREVTTSVVVHAEIQHVWQTVIAFPEITAAPAGIFRLGIAYPLEGRIDGVGVGAIRRCEFSTGTFVEPITRWEEPTLLAFDVAASPAPLRELSLYEQVDAPHLHGHMVSKHGQFHLTQRDDEVVVEGTTWYTHSLSPQWYWGPISDYMIHRIHERVLNHVKTVSEKM